MRGDVFHYEDRAYVPVKHEMKKEFFVALREAFLAWDPDVLRLLKAAMVAGGMSEEEVEREMYFNPHVFKGCVPRTVLPPSKLYWRVRAVFELYGPMVDSKTGVPLFNDQSWKKAQGVLTTRGFQIWSQKCRARSVAPAKVCRARQFIRRI